MRISKVARFLAVAIAAVFCGSCDSATSADARAPGVRVALPASFILGGAQGAGGASVVGDEVVLATLRVTISTAGPLPRILLERPYSPFDICTNQPDENSDVICSFSLDFPIPAGGEGGTYKFLLEAIGVDGVKYFEATNTFTLSGGESGTVVATAAYVGPGSDATGVVISPRSVTVAAGSTNTSTTCLATGTSADPTRVPLEVTTNNPAVATAIFTSGGQLQIFGLSPGSTTLVCRLDFGNRATDQVPITVTGVANPGVINGTLRNASTQATVPGASIELRLGAGVTSGQTVATATTNASGVFSFSQPAGTYTIRGSIAGYTDAVQTVVVVGGQTQSVTVPIAPTTGTSAIAVTVFSATTGLPLSGAVVEVRSGSNNTTGSPLSSATSGASGFASFSPLSAGTFTVRAVLNGYVTLAANTTVVAGQTTPLTLALSPTQGASAVRIVLTWGSAPNDLDGRLTVPGGQVIYFGNLGNCQSTPFACQDNDVTDRFGPETISVTQVTAGTYTYQVHDYSTFSGSGTALAQSAARVEVYLGNNPPQVFTVPNQPGVLWTVFTMSGTSLTTVNSMSPNPPVGALTAGLRADGGKTAVPPHKP